MSHRSSPASVLYILAFAFAAAALLFQGSYLRRVPAASAHPALHSLQAQAGGGSCKLSVGAQVQAVDAFRDMVPVFRHPRCINCHGAYDIFAAQHGDGEGAKVAHANGVNPAALLTAQQRVATFDSCNDCHSNVAGRGVRAGNTDTTLVSGWMLPPPPMMWTGLDDEALCVKVKSFESDASGFLAHVEEDHGEQRFVDVAFRGDRALPPDLMQLYRVTADAPPGGHGSLLAKANRWVELLDGHWNDPPSCGCIKPRVRLEVQHTWLLETPHGLPSRQYSDAKFEVDLMALGDDRPGYYQGNIVLDRRVDLTVPSDCTGRAAVKESWQFNLHVDPKTGSTQIEHLQVPGDQTGSLTCKHGGGTSWIGVEVGVFGDLGIGDMIIPPADSIGRKHGTTDGVHETLTIIVRARPNNP
jgi:hypothetical protein